jgi:hypothetical protein
MKDTKGGTQMINGMTRYTITVNIHDRDTKNDFELYETEYNKLRDAKVKICKMFDILSHKK